MHRSEVFLSHNTSAGKASVHSKTDLMFVLRFKHKVANSALDEFGLLDSHYI